jgi:hypothetical protein
MRVLDTAIPIILRMLIAVTAVLVSSCGGGGGGGDKHSDAPPMELPIAPCDGVGRAPCPTFYIGVDYGRYAFGVVHPTVRSSLASRVDLLVDGATATSSTSATTFRSDRIFTVSWDTSTVSDGVHAVVARAFDSEGRYADSSIAAVIVMNRASIPVGLSTAGVVPPPASHPTGVGELTVNLATGDVSGGFSLTGLATVESAHLHAGHPLEPEGDVLVSLVPAATDPKRWDIPAGSILSSDAVLALSQGLIYVDAHSPEGAVRGQVQPSGVKVWFATMTGAQVVPAVSTNLQGVAALTLTDHELSLYVSAFDESGLVSGTGAHVYEGVSGANGIGRFPLIPVGSGWYSTQIPVTATMDALRAGSMYVALETAAYSAGEIRGQLNAFVGVKLSELQASIFTPKCAGCHDGTGSDLPGSLDLRDGKSFASLVEVASQEQSTLKRVGLFADQQSYLIHKVEGLQTISGDRMPQFAPALSREEIDNIRYWISLGASNE